MVSAPHWCHNVTRRYLKVVQSNALIAVHSASSTDGEETKTALAVTTEMARVAAGLGVPLVIIGKMVTTPPDQAARLTRADLVSMGVIFADAPAPRRYASPALFQSPQPTLPPTTKPYEDSFADRRAWEWWFAGLAGAFKDGAEYWAGERSNPQPGSCYGPARQNLGDCAREVRPKPSEAHSTHCTAFSNCGPVCGG